MTRIFGGGIGFILAITGWWFTLWLWTPIYGDMLRQIVLMPIAWCLGTAGSGACGSAGKGTPLFVSSLIALGFVSIVIALGMKTYARIQKYSFYAGMLGLLIVIVLLFTGSPGCFQGRLRCECSCLVWLRSPVRMMPLSRLEQMPARPRRSLVVLLIWFSSHSHGWCSSICGPTGAQPCTVKCAAQQITSAIFPVWPGRLASVTVLGIIFFLGVAKTIGWDFYMQANGAWWNYAWGYVTDAPALPVWPYPALLAVFLTTNRLIQIVVIASDELLVVWLGGTLFLSSTRVIFAAAFDRLLPEKVAELNKEWNAQSMRCC